MTISFVARRSSIWATRACAGYGIQRRLYPSKLSGIKGRFHLERRSRCKSTPEYRRPDSNRQDVPGESRARLSKFLYDGIGWPGWDRTNVLKFKALCSAIRLPANI